jgi:hypothetical protein
MAVFLGCEGSIELRRTTTQEVYESAVNGSDVNDQRHRFSFDFETGMLLTGDMVFIRATDGGLLDFVTPAGWPDGNIYADGAWFLHVDEVGGIKLYRKFDDAVAGEANGLVHLQQPSRTIPIAVEVRSNIGRIMAQVSSFEMNTERDAVDVTSLSEDFRQQYSGLISGSGRITCFFDYQHSLCDPMLAENPADTIELPRYMNELILRTKLGSEFFARLYLIGRGAKPGGRVVDRDDEVYYEIEGVTTNVGMVFEPSRPIEATIDFVTTGRIHFRTKSISNYILAENGNRIQLEASQGPSKLLLDQL